MIESILINWLPLLLLLALAATIGLSAYAVVSTISKALNKPKN